MSEIESFINALHALRIATIEHQFPVMPTLGMTVVLTCPMLLATPDGPRGATEM